MGFIKNIVDATLKTVRRDVPSMVEHGDGECSGSLSVHTEVHPPLVIPIVGDQHAIAENETLRVSPVPREPHPDGLSPVPKYVTRDIGPFPGQPKGVDFASIDGNRVDFVKLRDAGKVFGYHRASLGTRRDSDYVKRSREAREVRFPLGGYMFWFAKKDPIAQVRTFLESLEAGWAPRPGDPIPAFDLEFPGNGRIETGLTARECIDRANQAVRFIRSELGVWPLLYTSARVVHEDLLDRDLGALNECPLWLARYSNSDPPAPHGRALGDFWLHQYRGDTKKIPGLSNQGDLDRFHVFRADRDDPRRGWVADRLGIHREMVDRRGIVPSTDKTLVTEIKKFQRRWALLDDGVIGPETFRFLAWERPTPL